MNETHEPTRLSRVVGPMNVIAILNENAGTAARDDAVTEESLRGAFAAAGFRAEIILLPPDQIEAGLKRTLELRPEAIVIGGGDGTVSAAAALVAGSPTPLGVLPLGTLNHFAKDLGLPPDWRAAIASLSDGIVRAVDVAEVNGHVFINNCSVGAYADAVRNRDALREQRNHGKWLAMTLASLRVFRRLKRIRFLLQSENVEIALRSPFLVVANNRYQGNILSQSLRDRLDDGQLWVYTTRARHHFAVLRMAWQALRRDLESADALDSRPTREATVHLPGGKVSVAADGEILEMTLPLHFRIRPGALQVLAPRERYVAKKSV